MSQKENGNRSQKFGRAEQRKVANVDRRQFVDGTVDQVRVDDIFKIGIGAVQRILGFTDIFQELFSAGIDIFFLFRTFHLHLPSCSGKYRVTKSIVGSSRIYTEKGIFFGCPHIF